MKPRFFDVVAFILSSLVVCGAYIFAYGGSDGEVFVFIESFDGETIYALHEAAEEARIVSIKGPIGITEIIIHNGEVRVLSSPCDEKTCIRMGPISKSDQWIACLPNGVIITTRAKEDREIDAVSY